MQDLSLLNKKCLANMPMLLDTMVTTLEDLEVLFSSVYDNIKEFMEENSFSRKDKKKIENLFLLSDVPTCKLKSLKPFLEICFELNVERKIKRSLFNLQIIFAYICDDGQVCDENQNVIFFQLIDNSKKGFLKNELQEKLKQNVPAIWRADFAESSIWIEFDLDETLCTEKINQCAEDFKQYILQPILDELNG